MYSIIKAFSWEYVARNRGLLLFFLFLPATVPAIVLASFQFDTEAYRSLEFAFIFAFIIPSIIAIASYGVIVTQGSPSRCFRLPLSNSTITNLFFWGGALLVGGQVALLIAILNNCFDTGLPVVSSTLFAIVCWGVYQPVFRERELSPLTIVKVLVVVPPLLFWFVWRNRLLSFVEAGTESVGDYWFDFTLVDAVITIATIAASYGVTLWRIRQDRCGRKWSILTGWNYMPLNGYLSDLIFNTKSLKSKVHANVWFDFRSRAGLIPSLIILLLLSLWLVGSVIGCSLGDATFTANFAFGGSMVACYLQVMIATLVAAKDLKLSTTSKTMKLHDFGIGLFPFRFPVKTADVARSIISSSAISISLSTAAIAISFLFVGLLREISKVEFAIGDFGELGFGMFAVLHVLFSMILSFVALNFMISATSFHAVPFRAKYGLLFLVPILLLALVVVALALNPAVLGLAFVIAIALSQLIYCTFESLRLRDVSYGTAVIVWVLGVVGIGVVIASRLPVAPPLIALGCLSILMAMLPVFAIPLVLRKARSV